MRFNLSGYETSIYIGGQGRKTAQLMRFLGDGGLPLLVPPEATPKFLSWIW